jgi:FkbM family methyltransferase
MQPNWVLPYFVNQESTCIDIGANIGTHLSIAKSAEVKMIYAFECNPLTASKLASTIRINGWDGIRVFDIALSNKESFLPFTIVKDNIGASYIPTNRKEWNGPLEKSEEVKCCSFDSLELNIDTFKNIVVKMDIEGHEIYALEGMKSILKNNKLEHVILELNPFCAWISNIKLQIDLLETYGLVPDILLFKVPGDAWSGSETSNSHYARIPKDDIMRYVEGNIILEVLFKRVKQVP